MSHSARSAWIETDSLNVLTYRYESHSARSAWIETGIPSTIVRFSSSRTPQGVRGLKPYVAKALLLKIMSHSARSAWIETLYYVVSSILFQVALRKECVD